MLLRSDRGGRKRRKGSPDLKKREPNKSLFSSITSPPPPPQLVSYKVHNAFSTFTSITMDLATDRVPTQIDNKSRTCPIDTKIAQSLASATSQQPSSIKSHEAVLDDDSKLY